MKNLQSKMNKSSKGFWIEWKKMNFQMKNLVSICMNKKTRKKKNSSMKERMLMMNEKSEKRRVEKLQFA